MENNRRIAPWTGIGINIQGTTTVAEALEKGGLDWQINQVPLIYAGNNTGYMMNVRETDQNVLGVVGGRYKPVQNVDAFQFVEELIGEGVTFEMVGATNNAKRVWLLAKLPDANILGEPVDPYICLTNSHDGFGSLKVFMTPLRVFCQNMINIALKKSNRMWSVRHTGSINAKLHEAQRTMGLATNYMKELEIEAQSLAKIKIAPMQYEALSAQLFPITTEMSSRKEQSQLLLREQLDTAWKMDDLGSIRGTGWGFVNAVSDMVTHKEPARKTENSRENAFMYHLDEPNILNNAYKLVKELV